MNHLREQQILDDEVFNLFDEYISVTVEKRFKTSVKALDKRTGRIHCLYQTSGVQKIQSTRSRPIITDYIRIHYECRQLFNSVTAFFLSNYKVFRKPSELCWLLTLWIRNCLTAWLKLFILFLLTLGHLTFLQWSFGFRDLNRCAQMSTLIFWNEPFHAFQLNVQTNVGLWTVIRMQMIRVVTSKGAVDRRRRFHTS